MQHFGPTSPPNLGQLLAEQVIRIPDKTAVIDGARHLTYAELHHQATCLAHKLQALGLQSEDAVLILAPRGLSHVISQVAVVYAGATCLPMEPTISHEDFRRRAQLAEAQCVIVDVTQQERELPVRLPKVVVGEGTDDHSRRPSSHDGQLPVPVASTYRSHILFTSGSTGMPKGVEILGRGITRLCSGIFEPIDRVAHVSSVSFDASLLELWATLIMGATCVVVHREIVFNVDQFLQTLRRDAVTSMFLTAAVFNAVALVDPAAFRSFNTVAIGGEAPNVEALKTVIEAGAPKRLLNAYGPTECSVLATIHDISLRDVLEGDIPLGQPLRATDLFVVDDVFGILQGEGEGELLIGGRGVARGYLNNPSLTRSAFVPFDLGEPRILYRTGDMVRRDTRGRIFWCGRRNNEVKHRGYRVNLDTIEAEIRKTGLVSAVAAMKVDDPARLTSCLAACVVLTNPTATTRQECRSRIVRELPSYMIPQIVCLDSMPVNSNGKIDRARLRAQLLRQQHDEQADAPNSLALSATEAEIRRIWRQVLPVVDSSEMGPETNLFSFGASSLDVSVVTMMIRRVFGVPFPVQNVFENPRLKDIAAEVDRERHGRSAERDIEELKRIWRADARMADQLDVPSSSPIDWTADEEGRVFITGVTGFVGAFFLRALLEQPFVRSVRCLVRAKTAYQGRQRILDNLDKYRLTNTLDSSQLSRIIPVVGDLSQPYLGLDDRSYSELARSISVIFHLGAQVNYNQPYSTHRPANVVGTFNILKLATSCRLKPVHYSSSIAAFGPTDMLGKKVVCERDDIDEYIATIPYETGYGQSQWVADKMVLAAIDRGLPAAVYRFGFVLCDDVTGVGNKDDYMGRLMSDTCSLGIYPSLPSQRKELLPVCYVVASLLEISSSPTSLGQAYHVTPDIDHTRPMDMDDVFQSIERILGRRFTRLPYEEWARRLHQLNHDSETRLKPLLPVLHESVWKNKTRWEMYENMAVFRNDNVRAALAAKNKSHLLSRSGITEEVLRRYLHFLGVYEPSGPARTA
ncbi:hypothetical protein VTK73DRAFT_8041 [Phialemonium thermophilum]|uniref:Carrier domain-containing protein n=1 Tax=Phialemonium thermophilum TaxID=223376 RepID=A0ABR3WAX5_9PEZI